MWCISRPNSIARLGIARRVPRELATRLVGVAPAGEIVAVVERRDRALERQDLQAVPRQFEIADDLRPQQAHDVREHRELEARERSLRVTAAPPTSGRRSSTSTFLPARARYAAHTRPLWPPPMMIASYRWALRCMLMPSSARGSKNGSLRTTALARLRWCSTVTSISTGVPGCKVRRHDVREREILLEQRRPAAARRVADLLAVRDRSGALVRQATVGSCGGSPRSA